MKSIFIQIVDNLITFKIWLFYKKRTFCSTDFGMKINLLVTFNKLSNKNEANILKQDYPTKKWLAKFWACNHEQKKTFLSKDQRND